MEGVKFPSLQHLTMVKIVGDSWDHRDVYALLTDHRDNMDVYAPRDLIQSLFYHCPANRWGKKWLALEKKELAKISALPLPETIKTLLANLVKPLGREIIAWYVYYWNNDYARLIDSSKPICWTAWGTVDYKRTAELYVKDEELDVGARYELACHNCLETEIRKLFNRVPENQRIWFMNRSSPSRFFDTIYTLDETEPILVFWTCVVSGEEVYSEYPVKLLSHREALDYSVFGSNRAASEYFFEKLNQQEKEDTWVLLDCVKTLVECCPNSLLNHSLPYFVLRKNEELKEELFGGGYDLTGIVLKSLLCWPWQSSFMEMAKTASPFMDEDDFNILLNGIIRAIFAGFKDYNYARLFREFWQLHPVHCLNSFLKTSSLANMLLDSEEDELMQFVVSEATAHQMQELVGILLKEIDENMEERLFEAENASGTQITS